jgi:bacterial/archaeal transporter family-2 protein
VSGLRLAGFFLLAVAGGVSLVIQQAMNAHLRKSLDSPSWAGFISYLGGTVTMLIVLLLLREPLLTKSAIVRSDWWSFAGGLFGAIYIVASILLFPRLGAATVVALIVVGQMFGSIIVDHFGLFGLMQKPVDLSRALGAALLILGVYLIRR